MEQPTSTPDISDIWYQGITQDELFEHLPEETEYNYFQNEQLFIEFKIFKLIQKHLRGEQNTRIMNNYQSKDREQKCDLFMREYDDILSGKSLGVPENKYWPYFILRSLLVEIQQLVCTLSKVCTNETCPIMKAAAQWTFLCASHTKPQQCCAIDYMTHTLDTSITIFNTRVFNPAEANPNKAQQHAAQVARRIYRVFGHVYFNHEQQFKAFENATLLHRRFEAFVKKHNYMEASNLLKAMIGPNEPNYL
ncbi:putative Mob1/phocein family protein [Blattamonas nauphoetae]|uniref:Mob1/phocein family protein n=1 Tax=Blattamonas nauphoetae TaxID=2049346 RepID=A0ABQ9Y4K2_9EUKA|nr:putative Mob1/phocein family protein [Blattamonas nauphoetae]